MKRHHQTVGSLFVCASVIGCLFVCLCISLSFWELVCISVHSATSLPWHSFLSLNLCYSFQSSISASGNHVVTRQLKLTLLTNFLTSSIPSVCFLNTHKFSIFYHHHLNIAQISFFLLLSSILLSLFLSFFLSFLPSTFLPLFSLSSSFRPSLFPFFSSPFLRVCFSERVG